MTSEGGRDHLGAAVIGPDLSATQPSVDEACGMRTYSQSLRDSRFVWDPAVHEQWGEHCSYFLARFADTDSRSIERLLSQHLARAKVSAFCIYVIFGYYDALIRAWLTPYKRTTLLEGLQEDADSLLEFQVDRAVYLWSEPSVVGRARIETLVPAIRQVSAALESHDEAAHSEELHAAIVELERERLLHRYPRSTLANPIKFFVALSRTANTPESTDTRSMLTGVVRDLPGIDNVSIYAGRGFASFLIKGVTDHLNTVLECSNAVSSHAKRLHLRPMTLLVANTDAFESDAVDTEWVEPDNWLRRLQLTLGDDTADAVFNLSPDIRRSIVEVYREHAPTLLLTPGGEYFVAFLRATVLSDYYLLGEKLTFIYRIEHLVRLATDQIWQDTLGSDWRRKVLDEATKIGVLAPRQPIDRLTLKGRVRVLATLVAHGDVSEAAVENVLDKKWQDNLLDEFLFQLRNDLAHGAVYEESFHDRFRRDWEQYANAVSYLCRLYNKLTGGAQERQARK